MTQATAHSAQRWMTIKEACLYARMSRNTLMACIYDGEIRANKRKRGGWIVDRESIDEYNDGGIDALCSDIAMRRPA